MYQCQIRHDVARSITYQFKDKFADYIRSCPNTPDTLAELQDKCGIRLVIGDKNDPAKSLEHLRTFLLSCIQYRACPVLLLSVTPFY